MAEKLTQNLSTKVDRETERALKERAARLGHDGVADYLRRLIREDLDEFNELKRLRTELSGVQAVLVLTRKQMQALRKDFIAAVEMLGVTIAAPERPTPDQVKRWVETQLRSREAD